MNIREIDLAKVNSMTKYPSILTYHQLGEKGRLRPELQHAFTGPVSVTEKVDGTNARMVFWPDGSVLLGSREEFLWERHDLIGNPSMGIVEHLKPLVSRLQIDVSQAAYLIFGELYGKNIGSGAKNYCRGDQVHYRLFDICRLPVALIEEILAWPQEKISSWREHQGQTFLPTQELVEMAGRLQLPLVPPLAELEAADLPTELAATQQWLQGFGSSQARLDAESLGVPEGVVIRNHDRSLIAKARREDYSKTLR